MAGVAAGVLLVDKPGGLTSHDVVARARRALGTRKIGHAGTLDPMATGLLVLGVEGATRLLTYVVGLDKTYTATIRLGVATDTDDAEGVATQRAEPAAVEGIDDAAVDAGIRDLTGAISQTPSTVSAIKVDGRRAYDLAREGAEVELRAREVVVSRFEIMERRRGDGVYDLDVVVDCSSGTYVRALARDLGAALGVGGHLTALRRTRIGPFDIQSAITTEQWDDGVAATAIISPAAAAAAVLPTFEVDEVEARDLRHGKRLHGAAARLTGVPAAAVTTEGILVGIVERRGDDVKSAMNMPEVP